MSLSFINDHSTFFGVLIDSFWLFLHLNSHSLIDRCLFSHDISSLESVLRTNIVLLVLSILDLSGFIAVFCSAIGRVRHVLLLLDESSFILIESNLSIFRVLLILICCVEWDVVFLRNVGVIIICVDVNWLVVPSNVRIFPCFVTGTCVNFDNVNFFFLISEHLFIIDD